MKLQTIAILTGLLVILTSVVMGYVIIDSYYSIDFHMQSTVFEQVNTTLRLYLTAIVGGALLIVFNSFLPDVIITIEVN